jgi:hypothetical protein
LPNWKSPRFAQVVAMDDHIYAWNLLRKDVFNCQIVKEAMSFCTGSFNVQILIKPNRDLYIYTHIYKYIYNI